MANFLTFEDLYTQIGRLIGDDNLSKKAQIKAVINQVYLNELLQADELYHPHWLVKSGIKQVIAPAVITGISVADPCVVTTEDDHNLTDGDLISIWNVVGMVEINSFGGDYPIGTFDNSIYRVGTVPSSTTFNVQNITDVDLSSSGFTAWTSGGKVLHQGWAMTTSIDKIISIGIYDGLALTRTSYTKITKDIQQFWTSFCRYN